MKMRMYINISSSSTSACQPIKSHRCHHITSPFLSIICVIWNLVFFYIFDVLSHDIQPSGPWYSKWTFFVYLLIRTSLITCPSALHTWANHSRRLLFINEIIFGLLYSFCSSWFFLLSYVCDSTLCIWPYMLLSTFLLKVIRRLVSPLVSDQVSLAYVTIGHR